MSDVYKIGVSIALANGVSSVLAIIGRDLLGLHTSVKKIESGFSRWGLAIGGVGAIMAGGAMLKGVATLVKHTKDLSHELVQIQKLGITPQQYTDVRKGAIDLSHRMPGVTEKDALKTYGSVYSIVGHEDAMKLLEPLSKFAQVVGNTTGKFDVGPQDIMKMIRSADLIGRLSDEKTKDVSLERLNNFLDVGAKVMLSTHGMVTANTWLGMAQQGGPSLMHMSDQGLMTMGMLSQAMGGQRSGTAMMSLFQQMAGGTMWKATALEMQKLGLLNEKDWKYEDHKVKLTAKASEYLTKNLGEDPLKWIAKDVLPAMEKSGIKTPEAQMRELFRFLQRQTTQRLTADMVRNLYQMSRERERMGGALNTPKAIGVQNSEDMEQSLHNMSKAWENLGYAIGGPAGQTVVNGLNKVTAALNEMGKLAHAHPEGMKIALEALVALGSALIISGIVALGVAIGGMIGVAGIVVALAAGLATFAALNWEHIKSATASLGSIGSDIIEKFKNAFTVVTNEISQVGSAIIEALKSAVSSVVSAVPGIFSSLGSAIWNALKSAAGHALGALGGNTGGNGVPLLTPQNYRAVPPAGGGAASQKSAAVYLDGRKVGAIITGRIADRAARPLEGSSYHDGTWHSPASDVALSMG